MVLQILMILLLLLLLKVLLLLRLRSLQKGRRDDADAVADDNSVDTGALAAKWGAEKPQELKQIQRLLINIK